jgi:uncharacterized protein YpuA (DUF1002 family)
MTASEYGNREIEQDNQAKGLNAPRLTADEIDAKITGEPTKAVAQQKLREAAVTLPWRTGRHVGRTIYATSPDDASGSGVLIGVMDTTELADEVVMAHNARWAAGK